MRGLDRRLLYLLLLLVALVVVVARWGEAQAVGRILLRAAPGLLVLGLLVQMCYFWTQAGLYGALCAGVGLPYSRLNLLPLMVVWPFVNVVLPAVGLAGVALLADDAGRRGWAPERAVVAGLSYMAFLYGSVGVVAWFGLVYLARRGLLLFYHIAAAVVHGLALAGLLLALGLAGWAPQVLARILRRLLLIGRWIGGRLRRSSISGQAGAEVAVERFHLAVRQAVRRPTVVVRALLWALVGQGANLLTLYLVVRALGREIGLGPALAGYGVSYLVTLVSPTPQGLGFTEGAAAALFHALGESLEGAVAITLAFRGMTFWVPFLAGLVLVRGLPSFRRSAVIDAQRGGPEDRAGERR